MQTLASSQSASLRQQLGGEVSWQVPLAVLQVPTVQGSPVAQSALVLHPVHCTTPQIPGEQS